MTFDFDIVDAHQHFARLDLGYPWLGPDAPIDRYHGDDRALRRNYSVADYRADIASLPIVASVHIENGAGDPLVEARWIDEVISAHAPLPAAQVAKADLSATGAEGVLEKLAQIPSVRGIRHILNWHPNPRFTHTDRPGIMGEPAWRAAFARLEPLGLSFDLQVFSPQLVEAAELARDFAGTRIVLDHLGMPPGRDEQTLAEWRHGMAAIAACPNVVVKVSAIGTIDQHWSVASLREVVAPTLDLFGPERVMFASNFPVDGLYSTMTDLYVAFDELTSSFDRSEREAMFAGTAQSFYRLPPFVAAGSSVGD